jgi:PilZ domain-containing protein
MGAGFLDVVRARDIGVGGVGVRVSHNFDGSDTNAAVQLVLILPREEAFIVHGIIRHLSSDGGGHYFGVAFESLTTEHRARIEQYVARRLAEGAAVSSG